MSFVTSTPLPPTGWPVAVSGGQSIAQVVVQLLIVAESLANAYRVRPLASTRIMPSDEFATMTEAGAVVVVVDFDAAAEDFFADHAAEAASAGSQEAAQGEQRDRGQSFPHVVPSRVVVSEGVRVRSGNGLAGRSVQDRRGGEPS